MSRNSYINWFRQFSGKLSLNNSLFSCNAGFIGHYCLSSSIFKRDLLLKAWGEISIRQFCFPAVWACSECLLTKETFLNKIHFKVLPLSIFINKCGITNSHFGFVPAVKKMKKKCIANSSKIQFCLYVFANLTVFPTPISLKPTPPLWESTVPQFYYCTFSSFFLLVHPLWLLMRWGSTLATWMRVSRDVFSSHFFTSSFFFVCWRLLLLFFIFV